MASSFASWCVISFSIVFPSRIIFWSSALSSPRSGGSLDLSSEFIVLGNCKSLMLELCDCGSLTIPLFTWSLFGGILAGSSIPVFVVCGTFSLPSLACVCVSTPTIDEDMSGGCWPCDPWLLGFQLMVARFTLLDSSSPLGDRLPSRRLGVDTPFGDLKAAMRSICVLYRTFAGGRSPNVLESLPSTLLVEYVRKIESWFASSFRS